MVVLATSSPLIPTTFLDYLVLGPNNRIDRGQRLGTTGPSTPELNGRSRLRPGGPSKLYMRRKEHSYPWRSPSSLVGRLSFAAVVIQKFPPSPGGGGGASAPTAQGVACI